MFFYYSQTFFLSLPSVDHVQYDLNYFMILTFPVKRLKKNCPIHLGWLKVIVAKETVLKSFIQWTIDENSVLYTHKKNYNSLKLFSQKKGFKNFLRNDDNMSNICLKITVWSLANNFQWPIEEFWLYKQYCKFIVLLYCVEKKAFICPLLI